MSKPNCRNIEYLLHKKVNQSRRKSGLNGLNSDKKLRGIARYHSYRMSKRKMIWHGDNVFRASKLIKNPLESVIGGVLIVLGFFIHYIFIIIGIVLLIISGRGYIGASGENVAMMPVGRVRGFKHSIRNGREIASALHKNWMNSLGHRKNILNGKFKLIGIGVKNRGKYYYATQVFYG